jgi:hypothetical protein
MYLAHGALPEACRHLSPSTIHAGTGARTNVRIVDREHKFHIIPETGCPCNEQAGSIANCHFEAIWDRSSLSVTQENTQGRATISLIPSD